VFISHSSRDREQASRLHDWLRNHGFVEAFLDFDKHAGLAPGSDWERTLYREIAGSEAVILVLTANWFESKWCFAEFTQARALGKAIFPLIESPRGEDFVSPDIQHINLIEDREQGLDRLSSEVVRIALNARGGFPWDPTRPPFPGLLAFDEAEGGKRWIVVIRPQNPEISVADGDGGELIFGHRRVNSGFLCQRLSLSQASISSQEWRLMDGDRAKNGLLSWRAKRRSIGGSSALWTRMLTRADLVWHMMSPGPTACNSSHTSVTELNREL
jgi:hypothetical protein